MKVISCFLVIFATVALAFQSAGKLFHVAQRSNLPLAKKVSFREDFRFTAVAGDLESSRSDGNSTSTSNHHLESSRSDGNSTSTSNHLLVNPERTARFGREAIWTPTRRSGTKTGRGGVLGSVVVELERKRRIKNRLQELRPWPLTHASAMACETLLADAEALLIPSPELQPYVTALATFKERLLHADPEYCSGETLLQEAKECLTQQATLLATTGEPPFEDFYCQDLMALHETMQHIKLPMHQELVSRAQQISRVQQRAKDIDTFESIAQEHLEEAHVDLCIHALRGELPASFYLTTLSAEAQDALNLLSFQSRTSLMKTNVDRAIQRLREAPLNTEPMGALLLAASYASPTHIARYRAYAIESLRRFCDTLVDGHGSWSPLVALVLSRLSNDVTGACARLCDPIAFTALLSPQEKSLLTPPPDAAATTSASSSPSLDTITGQYERIKANNNGQSWDALDAIMQLIGLRSMKEHVLRAVESMCHVQKVPVASRVPQTYHFALLGNPGTGKSTVAKHLATLLHQLQIRSSATVVETTGEKLAQMCPAEATALFDSALGGTLVIDEAYALNPKLGQSSGAIAMNLLDLAESKRSEISIIIIGNKDNIEQNLFQFNSGFARRFPYQITFDDYTDNELGTIFGQLLQSYHWTAASPKVVEVAARRVGRGRGCKSFGNAGDVRVLFEAAYQRAVARPASSLVMEIEDILGPPPTPETNPALRAALHDLDSITRLDAVKQRIYQLVDQAAINYQLELDGKKPVLTPLNAVFLGNSGTGKTTVAKIYGRVLKGLGMLTDGTCENYLFLGNAGTGKTTVARTMANMLHALGLLSRNVVVTRTAQDLQGAYIGQTKDKVNAAMAEEAVDQLIALMTAPEHWGRTVVILAGYRQAMEDMVRHSNEGLRSRFTGRIEFPNWDADDCLRYIREACRKERRPLEAPAETLLQEALQVAVTHPSWSNARDCITMQKLLYNAFAVRNVQGRVTTNSYSIEDVRSAMDEWRRLRPAVVVVESTASVLPMPPPVAMPVPIAIVPGPALPAPPTRDRDQAMVAPHQAVPSDGDTLPSEVEEVEEEDIVEETPFPGTDDPALIALEIACQEAGYDDNHQRRKELIHMLQRVLDGGVFPDDVIDVAMRLMAPASRAETITSLRPQVRRVLTGVEQAVAAEEAHLREVERIRDEEERCAFKARNARFQKKLRSMQLCPGGYTWQRCGDHWQCLGGSHSISDAELEQLCAG
eukprot:gene6182-4442_t